MRIKTSLVVAMVLAGAAAVSAGDASACGGCFHETEDTQVVGHRMILSISPEASTLWDQIEYSGDPASFAWVLPIKGQVDVGVSADALFQVLDQTTQVHIAADAFCPQNTGGGGGSFAGGGGSGGSGGGVTIIDQGVVGPYETVQLAANDPQALTDWLTSHGYNIPANIQPVIDAYVGEEFGFLALKLVPGQGISSMKPVRVTTPGAGAVLPLRMVAAGTGASTAIQLWVFGEGRYEPQNFPGFTINEEDLVYDWNTASSNYTTLVDDEFDASGGFAWLTDYALPTYPENISGPLSTAADQYADEQGMNAQANLEADMEALMGGIDMSNLWVTHMYSKLSQAALASDLTLQASNPQAEVSPYLQATKFVNSPCPEGSGGSGGFGGAGGSGGSGGSVPGGKGGCTCGVAGAESNEGVATLAFGLAVATVVSRRRRRRG